MIAYVLLVAMVNMALGFVLGQVVGVPAWRMSWIWRALPVDKIVEHGVARKDEEPPDVDQKLAPPAQTSPCPEEAASAGIGLTEPLEPAEPTGLADRAEPSAEEAPAAAEAITNEPVTDKPIPNKPIPNEPIPNEPIAAHEPLAPNPTIDATIASQPSASGAPPHGSNIWIEVAHELRNIQERLQYARAAGERRLVLDVASQLRAWTSRWHAMLLNCLEAKEAGFPAEWTEHVDTAVIEMYAAQAETTQTNIQCLDPNETAKDLIARLEREIAALDQHHCFKRLAAVPLPQP